MGKPTAGLLAHPFKLPMHNQIATFFPDQTNDLRRRLHLVSVRYFAWREVFFAEEEKKEVT
jgi:hypothetical protein